MKGSVKESMSFTLWLLLLRLPVESVYVYMCSCFVLFPCHTDLGLNSDSTTFQLCDLEKIT